MRRHFWNTMALAFALSLTFVVGAKALDYPVKPIRIVTPTPPGGGTDILMRLYAEKLSASFGQQVLVEPRPGGEGILAAAFVARSAPDGYTLFGTYDSFSSNPVFLENLPYDTEKDFIPISLVGTVDLMIAAHPSVPANTVQELVRLSKAKAGQITYGSIGKGSAQWILAELFNKETGAELRHIPYKERAAMTSDALAGRVSILTSSIAGILSQIRSGALKSIAVSSLRRSTILPDVPTLDESGLPGFRDVTWNGILAPAGVPREIIERLNAEIRKSSELPDVKERLEKLGIDAASSTPEEFATLIKSDLQKYHDLAAHLAAKSR